MLKGPFELYAFEYYVHDLKTSLELTEVRVQVKLFHETSVVLKPTPKTQVNQPPPMTVRSFSSLEIKEEKSQDLGSFQLDMRSLPDESQLEEEEVLSWEELEADGVISKPPVKYPEEGVTQLDSGRGTSEQSPEAGGGRQSGEGEEAGRATRQSLRMFPDDPTGQPYHKVKKGSEAAPVAMEKPPPKKKSIPAPQQPVVESSSSQPTTVPSKVTEPSSLDGEEAEQSEWTAEEQDVEEASESSSRPVLQQPDTISFKSRQTIVEEKDLFDAGFTLMLPMLPLRMVHLLQRAPLLVRVYSEDCPLEAKALLDLSAFVEGVLRAERGPPTPVVCSNQLILEANGDFTASIYCVVKFYSMGHKSIVKISGPDHPNDKMNQSRTEEKAEFEECNMDVRKVPALMSGPEYACKELKHFTKTCVVEYPPKKRNERIFFEEDLTFSPDLRIIAPKPADDYETMRWKIHQMLGLTDVEVHEKDEGNDTVIKEVEDTSLAVWHRKKENELKNQALQVRKKKKDTRSVLKKILAGMNEPDPIKVEIPEEPEEETKDKKHKKKEKTEEEKAKEEEEKAAARLYSEIQRQQREEKMIKHYKRLFRKMLRSLEAKKGIWAEELRRREKGRKRMADLLGELETYPAGDVVRTYLETMEGRKVCPEMEQGWNVDSWPDVEGKGPEEEEEEVVSEMSYYAEPNLEE